MTKRLGPPAHIVSDQIPVYKANGQIQQPLRGNMPANSYQNLIEVDALKRLIDASECRVIDCRFHLTDPQKGRLEYESQHIPGAVYADLDKDLAGPVTPSSGRHPLPAESALQALLDRWGIEKESQIVVYDHSNGAVAARLWWLMRWANHENIAVLNGGIAAWVRAGYALSDQIPNITAGRYPLKTDPDMVATTADIHGRMQRPQPIRLIDARDPKRFSGEVEPIDAVAGHVPGATNLPFLATVNSDGTWKSREELRRLCQETLENRIESPAVTMCGSGVTACHLLVTAHLLGLSLPKLYVGSWSEWIRDDARPIATNLSSDRQSDG